MDDLEFIKKCVVTEGQDFDQDKRIEKVQSLEYRDALALIFNWVKAGNINMRQFAELIEENRNAM